MLKRIGHILLLASLALATSCVTRGRDFSSDLGWIKKNQTTQTDVMRYLGAPFSVGSSGGVTTWTYGFYNWRVFGDSATKELKFFWTADQKVMDYSFNSSAPEDRRRLIDSPK